ncbi:hypothetical protein V2J09_021244 [Rumex salicifolius]
MAAQIINLPSISAVAYPSEVGRINFSVPSSQKQDCGALVSSFAGVQLSVKPWRSVEHVVCHPRRSPIITVLLSLPNSKPAEGSEEKLPKWSARAIRAFAMGELEARKLKHLNTGTESILMGILVEVYEYLSSETAALALNPTAGGTSLSAKFLRENGVTLFKVRDETVELLGKSDVYFFSPEHPPLTEQAKRALDWAIQEKLKSGEDGEMTATHLLLGVWAQEDSAGHMILKTLGFNDEKAKEIAKSMDKDVILNFR